MGALTWPMASRPAGDAPRRLSSSGRNASGDGLFWKVDRPKFKIRVNLIV